LAEVTRSPEGRGLGGFGLRLIAALIMVFATWNPSGHSFVDWVMDGWGAESLGAVHAFVAVVLLTGQVDVDDFDRD